MPFKKGDANINRNGRPKTGHAITDLMNEYLNKKAPKKMGATTYKTLFIKKLFELAVKGDIQAMKLIVNYIDGMPIQNINSKIQGEAEIMLIDPVEKKI